MSKAKSETGAAVVAIDMGYGHMRPARSIANHLGVPVLHADREPLADAEERRRWQGIRDFYEHVSRLSTLPVVGEPMRILLNSITDIPSLYPFRDLSSPNVGTNILRYSAYNGLGHSIVSYLQEHDLPLLTTFYSPAVLADYHGYDRIFCVVTDSDVNRVWAPIKPPSSKIHYFAPSGRVVRRLRAYGVNQDKITLTGFPLPDALVGGQEAPVLRRNLAARLARLDPKQVFRNQYQAELEQLGELPAPSGPPHLVFAVGGAGAQADLPEEFLPSLAPLIRDGRFRLTLVAGVRAEVKAQFETHLARNHLAAIPRHGVNILFEPNVDAYFARFDEMLADTDVLWTKPSEVVFYAGLGIPLLLTDPIGVHEKYNRQFARENAVALKQRDPRFVGDRLVELLDDGHLAAAAWTGYKRLPHQGLYRIIDKLRQSG
ncbi:MAG: hypothetical protein OXU20_34710 [Myxococcales bacterium]|nr:hypothetical protein [Myxococcales bacterium]